FTARPDTSVVMDVRTLHLLSSYVLLCLGTTALWLSESRDPLPYPAVTLVCAVAAYVVTDRLRIMQLPHLVSNTLAILILATSVHEFRLGTEHILSSLAHFLVYLQVAKFFREKTSSDFFQLYVLNALQVVLGTLLAPGFAYGAALWVYLALFLLTLILF